MIRTALFAFVPIAVTFLVGCRTYQTQVVPNPEAPRVLSVNDQALPRQIEIYFDGTANDWSARTNVRRRFEAAAQAEDPSNPCLYIEGVGTDSLAGKIFGVGMRSRVLKAYKFLAKHYRADRKNNDPDRIFIFGFSRGAFQARMLTGLMAHCGLPSLGGKKLTSKQENELDELAEKVWEYCEKNLVDLTAQQSLEQKVTGWRQHLATNRATLQRDVGGQYPAFAWSNPDIKLLAIWDTVPGLPFEKLQKMGEPENGRQRFKVGAYPNVKTIVHALSLDDRRSKFEPLPVGAPIDPAATNVYEVWFPGAHSDVGGGYEDSNDMAGRSFNWLHQIMFQDKISTRKTLVYEDSLALMHHPEDALIHRLSSDAVPRRLPVGAQIDRTAFRRADGVGHLEEGRRYVVYQTNNPVQRGPGHTQVMDVSKAGRDREAQRRYLASLGLVLHDDSPKAEEKPLPERGVQPLTITQMAASWNEVTPQPAPTKPDTVEAPMPQRKE